MPQWWTISTDAIECISDCICGSHVVAHVLSLDSDPLGFGLVCRARLPQESFVNACG